jgi:hypothetical protein
MAQDLLFFFKFNKVLILLIFPLRALLSEVGNESNNITTSLVLRDSRAQALVWVRAGNCWE